MCLGCRDRAPKRSLVRIVRPAATPAVVDEAGSAPGRGAYVHPSAACARAGVTPGRLSRALRASVTADEAARLLDEVERNVRNA
jgi:uncharacterized protein